MLAHCGSGKTLTVVENLGKGRLSDSICLPVNRLYHSAESRRSIDGCGGWN